KSAAGCVWHVHANHVREIALQAIEDLSFARYAGDENVVLGHARRDRMIYGVAPHADAMSNKNILGAAIGGVASEFAERSLRFLYVGENFTLDDDFCADGDLEILHATLGKQIGFAEKATNDLILSYLRWVGVDHRTHVVEWVNAERNSHG